MKQLPRNPLHRGARALVVRRETLRALAVLDLAQARGGGAKGAGTGPVDSCPPDQCTLGAA
jgi:hypothetical protein